MATVKRFEDLAGWELARVQCNEVYSMIQSGAFSDDQDLRGQMNRSSASVMDNIGEGFERFTRADFRHFLVIAKGSNGEMRSQLHRMADRRLISREHYQKLVIANELLGKKLYSFIRYLTTTPFKDKSESNNSNTPGTTNEPEIFYSNFSQEGYNIPKEFLLKR